MEPSIFWKAKVWITRGYVTRQLVSEQSVNQPRVLHVGMKTLGNQLLAQSNSFDSSEMNWRMLAIYHKPLAGRIDDT